jgi:hypothetical protein
MKLVAGAGEATKTHPLKAMLDQSLFVRLLKPFFDSIDPI